MTTTLLNRTEIELIVRVFINEISEKPLTVKRFRASEADHLDLLTHLESSNYIITIDDIYHLKIESLSLISEIEPNAGKLLEMMRPMYVMMRDEYLKDPDVEFYLQWAVDVFGYTQKDVLKFVELLSHLPSWSGRSNLDDFKNAYLIPSESILKYPTLDDAINTVKGWRKPPKPVEINAIKKNHSTVGDFSFLLHPNISEASMKLYQDGHLRDAVFSSIVALFDVIRQKTGLQDDGERLISTVFSLDKPYLILSELETESGKNDQKGFMQIFKGAFQGIRNPKAHTLKHDLDEHKAAQYLVFASLLMRRLEEATVISEKSSTPTIHFNNER